MSRVLEAQSEAPRRDPLGEVISSAELPREAKSLLISRIIESPQLNKSPRLTELLQYLTERALQDPTEVIREQEIGAVVFGKPADYDTNQDNIVRVQISQLRKKIEKFFETEGAAEPWILEIPRGHYLPVFRPRSPLPASAPPEPAPPAMEPPAPVPSPRTWLVPALSIALLLAIGVICALLWQGRQVRPQSASPAIATPSLDALWSKMLVRNQPTDIVLADSMLSLFQDRVGGQMKLQEYLNREYENKLISSYPPETRKDLSNIINRRYTSFADVIMLQRILSLARNSEVQPVFHFARDYQIRNLKNHNAIIMGSIRANLWIEMFERQTNFRFSYQDHVLRIVNSAPQPGEPSIYESPAPESGYAILAFLPNLDRTGSVLLLQGDDQVSTEGAGEFVTTEKEFSAFQRRLGTSGSDLPWFEAILKVTKVGNTARNFQIVAYRLPQ